MCQSRASTCIELHALLKIACGPRFHRKALALWFNAKPTQINLVNEPCQPVFRLLQEKNMIKIEQILDLINLLIDGSNRPVEKSANLETTKSETKA